ncbi:hypothetical protein DH2020_030107 [Rehmannia glutinosa]|uniref:K Homology domain-containing protein n=1 Tax=Rehmannia glutinosa TaxID=99300 RepID=A0ABR0VLS6_REHGL
MSRFLLQSIWAGLVYASWLPCITYLALYVLIVIFSIILTVVYGHLSITTLKYLTSIWDNEEKVTHLRFLLSNAEAGSVIGKVDDILKAVDLILSKLLDEDGGETVPESKIRLVVPNSSCGGLIGKGGSIIRKDWRTGSGKWKLRKDKRKGSGGGGSRPKWRSLIEDSRASIKISPQDNYYPGLHDRLVTVTGALAEQMRAVELILLKLVEDQYYHQSGNTPFPYAVAYNGMNYGPNGAGVKYQNNRFPNKLQEDRSSSITIGIADEHIGIVVGRGGRNIMEMSQLSGARIKISERGDFMSGTSDRKVTITGSQRAIRLAESMISRKIDSVTES